MQRKTIRWWNRLNHSETGKQNNATDSSTPLVIPQKNHSFNQPRWENSHIIHEKITFLYTSDAVLGKLTWKITAEAGKNNLKYYIHIKANSIHSLITKSQYPKDLERWDFIFKIFLCHKGVLRKDFWKF